MLIGLSGFAQSGKDTTASFIEQEWTGEFEHLSFARKLKESAVAALGIKRDDPVAFCDMLKSHGRITIEIPGDKMNFKKVLSGREFLQCYGTEAHRERFGDDFWVNACLDGYQHSDDKVTVITDVRFPNEAQRVLDLGGQVWEVVRRDTQAANGHASETPLDRKHVTKQILNSGSLDHLHDEVRRLLKDRTWLVEDGVETPDLNVTRAPNRFTEVSIREMSEL